MGVVDTPCNDGKQCTAMALLTQKVDGIERDLEEHTKDVREALLRLENRVPPQFVWYATGAGVLIGTLGTMVAVFASIAFK